MYQSRITLIENLEKRLNRDVLLICNNLKDNASLDYEMIDVIRRIRISEPKHSDLAIVIQTFGGDGMMSYFAVEFLREYYDNISIYIIGDCYSAGTIMALQTDEIYMGRNACLGAIDGQFYSAKDNGKEDWYPSLQANVNTLLEAERKGKITPELRKIFPKRQDLLAKYLRSENSDADLFKESLKKHCDSEKVEETWKYLLGVVGWHSVPLTFKKACKMGLDVKKMPSDVEIMVTELVRDAEEEFGELIYKTIFLDYVKALQKTKNDEEEDDNNKKKSKENEGLLIVPHTKTLAFIETAEMGFANVALYSISFHAEGRRRVPVILPLQFGWSEEDAVPSSEQEDTDKYNYIVSAVASMTAQSEGKDFETLEPEESEEIVDRVKAGLYNEAIEKTRCNGVSAKLLSIQQKQMLTLKYVLENYNIELLAIKDKDIMDIIEREVVKRIAEKGLDYEKMELDEIKKHLKEFVEECYREMYEQLGKDQEEFKSMTVEEKDKVLGEFIANKYGKENE